MTVARNKRRGADTEIWAAEHARSRGFCHAHRRTKAGARDEGDVFVNELVQSLEAKGTIAPNTAKLMREANKEAGHTASPIPAGLWRPPGAGRATVGEWIALLPYDALLDLLLRAEFPTADDSLWRDLWSRATDDVVTLVEFIKANGLTPPYVHTRKEPEVQQS